MLKQYIHRQQPDKEGSLPETGVALLEMAGPAIVEEDEEDDGAIFSDVCPGGPVETYQNIRHSDYLTPNQRKEVEQLVYEFKDLFTHIPGTTIQFNSIQFNSIYCHKTKLYTN